MVSKPLKVCQAQLVLIWLYLAGRPPVWTSSEKAGNQLSLTKEPYRSTLGPNFKDDLNF